MCIYIYIHNYLRDPLRTFPHMATTPTHGLSTPASHRQWPHLPDVHSRSSPGSGWASAKAPHKSCGTPGPGSVGHLKVQ